MSNGLSDGHSVEGCIQHGCLPEDGSYPHDVAVVEHIVGEQCQGRVTLVPYAGVDDATGQQGPRLYRDTTG